MDCAPFYASDKPITCEKVVCPEALSSFVGEWRGQFVRYVELDTKSGGIYKGQGGEYRPIINKVSYSPSDCFKTKENDVFLVGIQHNTLATFKTLPLAEERSNIIRGIRLDKSEFLRLTSPGESIEFKLISKKPENLAYEWSVMLPPKEKAPGRSIIINEYRVDGDTNTRRVSKRLRFLEGEEFVWDGVVEMGQHSLVGE